MSDNDERNDDDRPAGDGERRRPRRDDAGPQRPRGGQPAQGPERSRSRGGAERPRRDSGGADRSSAGDRPRSDAGGGRSPDRDRPRRDEGDRGRPRRDGAPDGVRGGARAGGRTAGRDAGRTGGRTGGRDDRGRGGASRGPQERQGGPRLTPKTPRLPEPAIREGITGQEVDRGVKNQLRTLSKENAEGVAQHLVMVAELLDVEPEAALAHAETAVRRAGRIPAAREALGLVAYRMGDWARALSEFRTVRRLSGSSHLLALMVDCERALGRLDKALELAQSDEAKTLAIDDRVELAIVVSGIRRDLGQVDAAVAALTELVRTISPTRVSAPRLYYAFAEAKLALGDASGAREWFSRAVDADHEFTTDASERLDELDGVQTVDLLGDDDDADLDE